MMEIAVASLLAVLGLAFASFLIAASAVTWLDFIREWRNR